jgi:hypothetical protein
MVGGCVSAKNICRGPLFQSATKQQSLRQRCDAPGFEPLPIEIIAERKVALALSHREIGERAAPRREIGERAAPCRKRAWRGPLGNDGVRAKACRQVRGSFRPCSASWRRDFGFALSLSSFSRRLREFAARNRLLHHWLDADDPRTQALLGETSDDAARAPIVSIGGGASSIRPTRSWRTPSACGKATFRPKRHMTSS